MRDPGWSRPGQNSSEEWDLLSAPGKSVIHTHFFQMIQFTHAIQFGKNHGFKIYFYLKYMQCLCVLALFVFIWDTNADLLNQSLSQVLSDMICHMLSERFMPMFHWCTAELCACTTSVCVFFFCEFACPGCASGFCPTLPGCHRWSQQVFFSCVYESAMSWWTDRKCFGALNMKPWPWAQSVHYSLCSAAHQCLFSDPGFLACFSSGFCLFVWFSFELYGGLTFLFDFTFIFKLVVCFIRIAIISNLSSIYGNNTCLGILLRTGECKRRWECDAPF